MSTTSSRARAKRSRSATASTADTKRTTQKASATVTRSVSADQRQAMIAESAYRRAEARGFRGGDPVQTGSKARKRSTRYCRARPTKGTSSGAARRAAQRVIR